MSDPISSTVLLAVKAIAPRVSAHVRRLRAERHAGATPGPTDLMEVNLDETLNRLRKGNIDESWWKNILNGIEHSYVAPDFLNNPAVQNWLANDVVSGDLKSLAKDLIWGGTVVDPNTIDRLKTSFPEDKDQQKKSGTHYIEDLAGILAASFLASIPRDQSPLAGMQQNSLNQIHERFDGLEEKLSSNLAHPEPKTSVTIQQLVSNSAKQELSKILSLRTFDASRARSQIRKLLERTRVGGNLAAAGDSIKIEVLYWAARLCAVEKETLPIAKQLREELRQADPNRNLSIVDALIAEKEGDDDLALRLLRDCDDPDSRSVWFGLLDRLKGQQAAWDWVQDQDLHTAELFTPVGWLSWGIVAAKLDRWQEACRCLSKLENHWHEMPMLALFEGTANAAMLLPAEHRKDTLSGAPLVISTIRNQDAAAQHHHSRANTCFEFIYRWLEHGRDVASPWKTMIADWQLWLRLMNPIRENAEAARRDVKRLMNRGEEAVGVTPFAFVFEISFDALPLKEYLAQRKELGGLDDRELLAECLLNVTSMPPDELLKYLDHNTTSLEKVLSPAFFAKLRADSLRSTGQTSQKVREVLGEHSGRLDKADLDLLLTFEDIHEGKDIREKLQERYEQSDRLVDLRNLVTNLRMPDDRDALRPLVLELFNRAPTVEHAMLVIASLAHPSDFDHEAIIEFLDQNAYILEQSDDLKTAKAWALFHAGELAKSREINDAVKNRRAHPDNLLLDYQITVASGQWSRLAGVLQRAWSQRDALGPQDLMHFAHVAGSQDQHDLALSFSEEAAKKAPENPHILAAAYFLCFQLGLETEANPGWLQRAIELSSPEEGPIQLVSLEDVISRTSPKHQDHAQEVERKWRAGEIPMSLAADVFNISLSRLLIKTPQANAIEKDARRWEILPIVHGGREPVDLHENWTIGLDFSSILVLTYLNLLEQAIQSFHHVKLAPNVMTHLLREQQEVRFHQPSRVRKAQQVLALENQGQLALIAVPRAPSQAIIAEVGSALAALLHIAKDEKGKVVCATPIHKAGSLMEQEADISGLRDLIVPIADFCRLLHQQGKIDTAEYKRGKLFLGSQGQTETAGIDLDPMLLNAPVYVDDLAFRYLLGANLLEPIAAAKELRLHPDVAREQRQLVMAGETGEEMADRIDGIRRTLRNLLERGRVSLLPQSAIESEKHQNRMIRFEATESLLTVSGTYDALCIDDRHINSHMMFVRENEEDQPIFCVLDVLRHLYARKVIEAEDYWTARHKLRQGGFALIPLESDELVHWLKAAHVEEGQLVESMELRVIRQAAAHLGYRDLASWQEWIALYQNSQSMCFKVIAELWADETLPPDRVAALTSWVWLRVMTITVPHFQGQSASDYAHLTERLADLRLSGCLSRTPGRLAERQEEHDDWISRVVLGPLQPANAHLIQQHLASVRAAISEYAVQEGLDEVACGIHFMQSLPRAAQQIVADTDMEFMQKCGIRFERTLSAGNDVQLEEGELFRAAKEVLQTQKEQRLQAKDGNEVLVAPDDRQASVVVKNPDGSSDPWSVEFPELALFSPNPEVRLHVLRQVIDLVGPAGESFRQLLPVAESRALNEQELTEILEERARGVAARQAGLIHKIRHRLPFGVPDIIPSSISYFERFCGPDPCEQGPEEYLQDVLIPYRKKLLERDFEAGLDICCLGALRDDLLPADWVAERDGDALWKALISCHPNGNPFSLLAALDIALFRQDDPRFREFAFEALDCLTDERFGQENGIDIYKLLPSLYYLTINQMSLLKNAANYPGYWKRMSAWMQAGFTVRAMAKASTPVDMDAVQTWAKGHISAPGVYVELLDGRKEPMLSASRMAQDLRNVVIGRLYILRTRHESMKTQGPAMQRVNEVLAQMQKKGRHPAWDFPGVLEDHKRPSLPLPEGFRAALEQAANDNDWPRYWQTLAIVSKLFALNAKILEQARKQLRIAIKGTSSKHDLADSLERANLASLVAAAHRDTKLAEAVADATGLACKKACDSDIQDIVGTLLQAAVAHEEHSAWFKWLERKLALVAERMPSETLKVLLEHLEAMEMVLPTRSWFHLRARAIALTGAVS